MTASAFEQRKNGNKDLGAMRTERIYFALRVIGVG